jgi:hypothetical protein
MEKICLDFVLLKNKKKGKKIVKKKIIVFLEVVQVLVSWLVWMLPLLT